MTVLTWTDEQIAVTIWATFTFAPLMVIEGWMRWNRLLDRIAAAGAVLVSFADGGTRADQVVTDDADYPDLRVDPARAATDGNQGVQKG